MIEIGQYYVSFGREVVEEVKHQLEMNGDLMPVLHRLNVSALPGLTAQHNALRDFLYKYGTAIFLKAMKTEISTEEIERLKIQRLISFSGMSASAPKPGAKPPDPGAYKPAYYKPGTGKPGTGKPQQAKPQPAKEAAPPAAPEPPKWIETPTYVGPDRRRTKDRRKAQYGRRMRTDNVRMERRSSARRDRRQTPRRAEDRTKLAGNRPPIPAAPAKKPS